MSIRVLERVVQTDDGEGAVGVRRDLFGTGLTVTWFCGDKRTFTPGDIESLIRCVEALAPFPDVWLQASDSASRTFYMQLKDNELHANTEPAARSGINWEELKKVLAKAIK